MPTPPFVVLDTETTGLDPAADRVIDLGAVRLDGDLRITDRFQTLVDPRIPVPLAITRLVGLTDADLAGAPSFAQAYESFRAWAGDAVLVAHNAAFDRDHLTAGALRVGLPPPDNEWLDTLEAALLLYPELDRHALPLLAAELGVERPSHRALPDAETAAELLARLAARAAGLAAAERRLLSAVSWPPLGLLDACAAAPDQAPPPLVAPDPPGGAHETLTTLPVEPDGWRAELEGVAGGEPLLAERLPGFRRRPGQLQLAAAAAGVLRRGGVGLFEAGTGMGKSLAYLLPAAWRSAATGRRVVVSTRTKALQRQLAAHELPLAAAGLPAAWRWAVLMGRENYLCRRRLDEAVAAEGDQLPDAPRSLALAYLLGRARRGEVDLSALPYRASQELPALAGLARELRSSRATCLGRHCPARRGCHWRLARSRAEAAHLVCVNHALLLTGPDTLPSFDDVIIDEAHLLYGEATEAFSVGVDPRSLELLLADLRGRRRQRALGARLRAAARHAAPQQALPLALGADAAEHAAATLPELVQAVGSTLPALIEAARQPDDDRGPAADYDRAVWLTPGLREHPAWDPFVEAASLLADGLSTLAAAAAAAAEVLPDDHREHAGLVALADEADTVAGLLRELPESAGDETVVWAQLEARRGGTRPQRWSLVAAPLTPAAHVRERLWDRLRAAVLTSATLTVAGSFDYYRSMTGLHRDVDVDEQVFPSPFDFRRQAALVLERDAETWHPERAPRRQAERLKELARVTGGRTLALFTNTRDMHSVAAAVGAHVEADGVLVLAQGLHGTAAALAEEFRAHPETVLLGVDTLWTGQDFPGDTLVCLVIAKLPFPRQDPLFHARRQACLQAGDDWFRRFYLPEAVLKFRQGFGRLIRTEDDAGVVVVLDHRLAQKAYRRDFIDSLPDIDVTETTAGELAVVVERHLERLGAAERQLV